MQSKEQCKVMHVGTNNPKYEYHLKKKGDESYILNTTNAERDLGVVFTNDLKWKEQVATVSNKANRALGLVKKTFKYKNQDIIKRLYVSLVRPHLEYAVQVWHPYLKSDISSIERVQRRATKLVGQLKNCAYESRLSKLNLLSLEARRIRGDLIQQYKFCSGIDLIKWHYPVKFSKNDNSKYETRSHMFSLDKQLIKNCAIRSNFFTNRVTNSWNSLTNEDVNQKTINSFKNKIDKKFIKYDICSGYYSAQSQCTPGEET